jgi:hypothetical protein
MLGSGFSVILAGETHGAVLAQASTHFEAYKIYHYTTYSVRPLEGSTGVSLPRLAFSIADRA